MNLAFKFGLSVQLVMRIKDAGGMAKSVDSSQSDLPILKTFMPGHHKMSPKTFCLHG